MATIFAGENLANVFQLNDNSQGDLNPHVYYTVPAGHWAKVTLHHAVFGSGAGNNGAFLFFGLIPFNEIGAGGSLFDGSGGLNQLLQFNSSGMLGGVFGDGVAFSGAPKYIMSSSQTILKSTGSGGVGTGIEIFVTIQEFVNP